MPDFPYAELKDHQLKLNGIEYNVAANPEDLLPLLLNTVVQVKIQTVITLL